MTMRKKSLQTSYARIIILNNNDPASLHKYTYAQNNPQMYNDPSGHFISTIEMCINSA